MISYISYYSCAVNFVTATRPDGKPARNKSTQYIIRNICTFDDQDYALLAIGKSLSNLGLEYNAEIYNRFLKFKKLVIDDKLGVPCKIMTPVVPTVNLIDKYMRDSPFGICTFRIPFDDIIFTKY